jgi:hypothetical protein
MKTTSKSNIYLTSKKNYIRQSKSLVHSTYFYDNFVTKPEFASSIIYFYKLTISQSIISIQPFQKTIGDFLNDFSGWKMKIFLVIFIAF